MEVDPRAVEAVGRAANVASWSAFGALVGGPVGALVAGGTAAAVNGVQHLRQRRRRRGGDDAGGDRRPFLTFTTTSYTTTPWGGTTVSVTSNAGGRRRTVRVRDGGRGGAGGGPRPGRMSPADRHILQMLMTNAVRRGAATPENADGMSFEELLRAFGLPEDDAYARRRRGAAPELIEGSSTLRKLDGEKSVAELKGNQSTCNICLEEFKEGDEMRKLNHCSHTFHKECIDRWLSQVASCPICKHELDPRQGQREGNGGG